VKKYILYILITVAFVAVAGVILVFGFYSRKTPNDDALPPPPPPASNVEALPPAPNTPPPTPTPVSKLPDPPENYDKIIDNNPALTPETKASREAQFADILKRISEQPERAVFWADLGAIKYAFDDYLGAEQLWLYTFDLDSSITVAQINLAQLYWHDIPNFEKSERFFRFAIDNNEAAAVVLYRDLSDLYRYSYEAKSHLADDVLLEAYERFPNAHGYLNLLGWYYMEQNDNKKAIEYFERFLETTPDDESTQEELERLKASQ
jgi:tetratricopeptide (TPR) repeat protein